MIKRNYQRYLHPFLLIFYSEGRTCDKWDVLKRKGEHFLFSLSLMHWFLFVIVLGEYY